MFKLVFPLSEHELLYWDMIQEWKNFENIPTSPRKLFIWENYTDFLHIVNNDLTNNINWVNSSLFFFMEDDQLIGWLQIRHHIDHPNLSLKGWCGGHIWYWLRPSARWRGLSLVMLELWLLEARKLGITDVIISAYKHNLPSWKTIERLGWVLLKEIDSDGYILRVYIIQFS